MTNHNRSPLKNHDKGPVVSSPEPKTVLSGMRTTGRLHLGNYHGALKNWISLQSLHPCLFFAADIHALTTDYEHPQKIKDNTWNMVIDWLGAGLDPKLCTFFVQSEVPQHAELHLLLSMITPLSWLERVPTYKEQKQNLKEQHINTFGFLGYPALQAADILIYKARLVPVGEDQLSHVELTREIARHFNHLYVKPDAPRILPEPETLLTKSSKMPGLDGRKMSKSYHNTIELREDPTSVEKKIKHMPTDPARVRRVDPGNPEKCPVWEFHKLYSNEDTKAWVMKGCTTAGIGCLECKQPVIDAVLAELKPIRERAEHFSKEPRYIRTILDEGAEKARAIASATLQEVKEVMGL